MTFRRVGTFARAGAVLAVVATACAHRTQAPLDQNLPDNEQRVGNLTPLAVLEAGASEDDPTPRARALELLVLVSPEPAGGAWGARALFDPDPWVQRRGVLALAERLDEPEAVALLDGYVRRTGELADPYVRGLAAQLLTAAGHDEIRDAVQQAWRQERERWRAAPLQLAAALLGDTEAIAPLGVALSRGDIALEVDFVLSVGDSGLTALVPALAEGQEWVEEELAVPYAVARLILGDAGGEGVLRKAMGASEEETRLEALDYLTRMDHPAATHLLQRALSQGSDLSRSYVELALAARGELGIERIERALADPDRDVRTDALRFAVEAADRGVSKKAPRIARKAIKAGLSDEDPVVRMEAVRAMGVLGEIQGADEYLRYNLSDEYLAIRVEAAGALLLLAAR